MGLLLEWSIVKTLLWQLGVIAHFLIILWLVVRVIQQQRRQSVAIAWIAVLFALPVVGIIGYMLFGEINIGHQYRKRSLMVQKLLRDFANAHQIDFNKISENLDTEARQLSNIALLKTGLGVYDNHTLTLITDADHIFASLLADIRAANTMILLEFYIVSPQGRVIELLEALMAATQRGVSVHLLADSVGSHAFFRSSWVKKLKAADVFVHESLPVGLFKTIVKRIDIRNHRKLAIFDSCYGYTGSFNLIDPDFFKQDAHVGKWIDAMIRVESHDTVNSVKAMALVTTTDISAETNANFSNLEKIVNRFTKSLYIDTSKLHHRKLQHEANARGAGQNANTRVPNPPLLKILPLQSSLQAYPSVSQVSLQLIPSAPELTEHVIYETLVCAIFAAKKQVVITTPYFVPDDALLLAMTTAAKRGVKVILNVPKKVDSLLVQFASQAYFDPLLSAGVQIYLFNAGLLHAKILCVDDDYCLFGTVNMDMRSFYLNMEVSMAIYNRTMTQQILTCQHEYLRQSEPLQRDRWQQRSFGAKFLDNAIRLFSPLL
ncbi:phospholipase D-like domain-containing protein [Moraxella osloensis]|uniref:phospholipase D-like domain-containing protein n=1 Tax=Faucicola osloensis TaxID=34062 RepID=UPI002004A280|nr:phospholipase D-like domain-containing protein [Moraxella osloensis]MCK6052449.1 PLDc N-terminal domain-containing protein [Moraxella osloensis]